MRQISRLVWVALGLMVSCAASAGARVSATTSFTGVRVVAVQRVQADAETVWTTLTDYNRLATFIPDMLSSRVISPPGSPKQVEQIGDSGVFAYVLPDHVILLMEESPSHLIRFRALSGKVLTMQGEWRISGESAPVTLTYRAHIMPLTPLPPLVSEYFVEDEVKRRFEAVGREAERRMRLRQ